MFSSGLELPAKLLSLEPYGGTLVFSKDGIAFYPTFTTHSEVHIAAGDMTDFAITTSDTRTSEITLPRLIFLKWLAFAFPKKSGDVMVVITVGLLNSQHSYQIDDMSLDELSPKIIPYLDTWGIVLR